MAAEASLKAHVAAVGVAGDQRRTSPSRAHVAKCALSGVQAHDQRTRACALGCT